MAGESESEDKKSAGKSWLDILGQRMDQEPSPPGDKKPPAEEKLNADALKTEQSRSVRFSDLAPPTNTIFQMKAEDAAPAPDMNPEDVLDEISRKLAESAKKVSQMTAALPSVHELPAMPLPSSQAPPRSPAPPTPKLPFPAVGPEPQHAEEVSELRRKLSAAEKQRESSETRISELEAEVESLRAYVAESNVQETEELQMRLAEAYEIIRTIEQAYLAGECVPPRPPAGHP